MAALDVPNSVEELTAEFLTSLVQQQNPETIVENFTVVKAMQYGDGMVSTAARAILELHYQEGTGDNLPTRVIMKLAYDLEHLPWPLYANEVRFYEDLRQELPLEIPQTLGAVYDHTTHCFILLLEDLTVRGAEFPNVLRKNTVAEIKSILDVVAGIHARYWQSPRFDTDLANLETHVTGPLNDFMIGLVPLTIQHEVDISPYKQELMSLMNTTCDEMLAGLKAVQKHQATLPQTLLHGDTHSGNTYLMPDGSGGLLDFQLMVRGYCMHDISYLITTFLPIEVRRKEERELIKYYLGKLAEGGVANPPSFEQAWDEYRRTLVWGVYIGWMTTNEVNYGWEIQTVNLLRLTTAYMDHGTAKLVKEVM